jgi:ribose/xylose/arabinose/galactoside ABC-type transport system permease subunit
MTAIVSAISGALLSITGVDVLKQIMLVCGAGLLVTLLLLTYGLDLSPGFF